MRNEALGWRIAAFAAGLTLIAALSARVHAQPDPIDGAVQKAVEYIRAQQAADGTFAGVGGSSTADAVIALAAADVNVSDVKNGEASAIDGLAKLAPEAAKDTGVTAKFVMAALLAGQNPRTLGGTDLVAAVEKGYNAQTKRYGKDVASHALALLALNAAGGKIPVEAVQALYWLQLPDGGWSFDGAEASGSDTNTASLSYQALLANRQVAGGDTQSEANLRRALDFLRSQQNTDAGFPSSQRSQFGNASDANSTALAIQAIIASGDKLENWAKDGKTPSDRLIAFQNESGALRFQDGQPQDNQFATYQAVPALEGAAFPLEGIAIAQPAVEDGTATAGADETATAVITDTAVITGTATLTSTVTITDTAAITGTADVGRTAVPPRRLPDTGTQPEALVLGLALGLVVLSMGLLLRRRSA